MRFECEKVFAKDAGDTQWGVFGNLFRTGCPRLAFEVLGEETLDTAEDAATEFSANGIRVDPGLGAGWWRWLRKRHVWVAVT